MRTGFIIIGAIILVIAAAFLLKATNTIKPAHLEARNKENSEGGKGEKDKDETKKDGKKGKKDKNAQGSPDDEDDEDKDSKGEGIGKGGNTQNSAAPEVSVIKKFDVPDILKEISALSYIDADRFATVQDERGSIFIYNMSSKKIEKEIPFGGKGDYEGIAIVNNDAYVLRADGRIFEVKNYRSKPAVVEHKTRLTAKHDTEAICYDRKNNRLLVAIKASESGSKDFKGIYAFNLSSKTMPAAPVYKIDLTNKVFESGKKGSSGMNPSAIAIHPLTGEIYITEGTKPKLLILDGSGRIKSLRQLDSKIFNQPEGITISPEGRVFISNEGTKDPGNILEVKLM